MAWLSLLIISGAKIHTKFGILMLRTDATPHPALFALAERFIGRGPIAVDDRAGSLLTKVTNLAELRQFFNEKIPPLISSCAQVHYRSSGVMIHLWAAITAPGTKALDEVINSWGFEGTSIVGSLYEFKVAHDLVVQKPGTVTAIYMPKSFNATSIEALKWDLLLQLRSQGTMKQFLPLQVKLSKASRSGGAKNFVFNSHAFPFLGSAKKRERFAWLVNCRFLLNESQVWEADCKLQSVSLNIFNLSGLTQEELTKNVEAIFSRVPQIAGPILLDKEIESMLMSDLVASLIKQRKLVKLCP